MTREFLSALALVFLSLQAFSCGAQRRMAEAPEMSEGPREPRPSASDWLDPPEVQTCPGAEPCPRGGDDTPDGGEVAP